MPRTLNDIGRKLPGSIGGWTRAAPPVVYTPQNLSTYIDGGAELYLSYNFRQALSLKYKTTGKDEITVDIFEMGTSADAFGVFAHSRETIDSTVGQGSEYAAGLLTFWKDRYYVSILAYPETPAKKDVVFTLGRTIADSIEGRGTLPPIISLLPAEGLAPQSVRYFHHYIWLNSFYFVSDENVLDIGNDTPAALGTYKQGGVGLVLLLVRYPSAARAEAAAARFRKDFLGGAPGDLREMKGGRWSGLLRRGDLIAVVFNAPAADAVRAMFIRIKG